MGYSESEITYRMLIEAIEITNGDTNSPELENYLKKELSDRQIQKDLIIKIDVNTGYL